MVVDSLTGGLGIEEPLLLHQHAVSASARREAGCQGRSRAVPATDLASRWSIVAYVID